MVLRKSHSKFIRKIKKNPFLGFYSTDRIEIGIRDFWSINLIMMRVSFIPVPQSGKKSLSFLSSVLS